jgi:MarR family transcriptional regulator, organic hydroperoxide resistance regulator
MTQSSQDDILKLDSQLCFALYAAARAMTNSYRDLLATLGLTYPQYLVMLVLWEHGTRTVKDVGQMLYLDSGTLSPLLKRLETAGFVERKRSNQDERSVEVHLTEAGLALKSQATPVAREFICRTALETEAFTHLREQLHQLTATLSETNEGDNSTNLCLPETKPFNKIE